MATMSAQVNHTPRCCFPLGSPLRWCGMQRAVTHRFSQVSLMFSARGGFGPAVAAAGGELFFDHPSSGPARCAGGNHRSEQRFPPSTGARTREHLRPSHHSPRSCGSERVAGGRRQIGGQLTAQDRCRPLRTAPRRPAGPPILRIRRATRPGPALPAGSSPSLTPCVKGPVASTRACPFPASSRGIGSRSGRRSVAGTPGHLIARGFRLILRRPTPERSRGSSSPSIPSSSCAGTPSRRHLVRGCVSISAPLWRVLPRAETSIPGWRREQPEINREPEATVPVRRECSHINRQRRRTAEEPVMTTTEYLLNIGILALVLATNLGTQDADLAPPDGAGSARRAGRVQLPAPDAHRSATTWSSSWPD